ncbi:MAG: Spo0E family sporulation regulatory protein-aspartic acid phosphatase [Heyndrickxia sp.]|jgi:hypothetical protein
MSSPELLLINCIDRMKNKMIERGKTYGLDNEEKIRYSQQIDELINI